VTSNSGEEWRETTLKKALERAPERAGLFDTTSHIPQQITYSADDLKAANWDERERLGYPGEYPFTRGVQPTMYRGRLWTMRQYAGYASAEESNARYRYLLDRGQTGLSVAFDLPTQMGYDPDHPMAEGEVGKVGVSIASLEDMEQLLEGIPLDQVTTSMTINATAAILLALYIAVAKKQGLPPHVLSGTVQNDILKEYIARGTYIYPPRPSLRLITDLFAYAQREVPQWNTISISGYHMREAGATAVQELAFTLANGIEYVNAALQVGLQVDSFAPRLAFFFDSHNNLLEEVAKFRAADVCGRGLCASALGHSTHVPGCCAFILRRPAYRCKRSKSTTTWRVLLSKLWRPYWAGHSRSTPTQKTKRSLSQPRKPPRWRCARSKFWPMKVVLPTLWTRWRARTTSNR